MCFLTHCKMATPLLSAQHVVVVRPCGNTAVLRPDCGFSPNPPQEVNAPRTPMKRPLAELESHPSTPADAKRMRTVYNPWMPQNAPLRPNVIAEPLVGGDREPFNWRRVL